jgi:hypothetical protein
MSNPRWSEAEPGVRHPRETKPRRGGTCISLDNDRYKTREMHWHLACLHLPLHIHIAIVSPILGSSCVGDLPQVPLCFAQLHQGLSMVLPLRGKLHPAIYGKYHFLSQNFAH